MPSICFSEAASPSFCHSGCACCVNSSALLTSLQSLLSHSSSDFLLLEVKGGREGKGWGRGGGGEWREVEWEKEGYEVSTGCRDQKVLYFTCLLREVGTRGEG